MGRFSHSWYRWSAPDLDGYAERGGGAAGLVIAAVWVLVAGSVIYLERRRLFPARQE